MIKRRVIWEAGYRDWSITEQRRKNWWSGAYTKVRYRQTTVKDNTGNTMIKLKGLFTKVDGLKNAG